MRRPNAVTCTSALGILSVPISRAQIFFEVIQRGQVERDVLQATEQSTLYILASLARLGVVFDVPPKVYPSSDRSGLRHQTRGHWETLEEVEKEFFAWPG